MPIRWPACSTVSVVSVASNSAPPRATRNVTGAAGLALVRAAASAGEWTGAPSIATMRSPGFRPARSAGLPSMTWSMTGAPKSASNPRFGMKLPSHSARRSEESGTRRVEVDPSGRSISSAATSRPEARSNRQRRSCQLCTGSPSTATTRSPVADAGRGGGRVDGRRRKQRPLAGNADDVGGGEQHDGEQQVRDRARNDDGHPPAHVLAVEGAVAVRRRDVALALVRHLDVAAERHCGNRPLGTVRTEAARPEDAPEADGKPQHLDPDEARDPEVAEFVEDDEHAQHDQKRQQFLYGVHQAATGAGPAGSFSHARVTMRDCASAASASSSVGAPWTGSRASVSAHADAMSR